MKRKVIFSLLGFIVVIVTGFLIWGFTPLGPDQQALLAIEDSHSVDVSEEQVWLLFTPGSNYDIGFIFYPSGHVDYRSYAPDMQEIALQGYLVALPHMPLSLAVLVVNRAVEIIDAHPEVQYWVIGGHSLGGSMAANFVFTHPDIVDGLVLWASYPAKSNDLSIYNLRVISITASMDGVINQDNLQSSIRLLPADTRWDVIEGGNHAGFGSYGKQPGDQPASIDSETQRAILVELTTNFLAEMSK